MSLRAEVASVYEATGPTHFMPFIGDAYEIASPKTLRVLVVGINSYISEGDWRSSDEMRGWFRDWWAKAACNQGATFAFYTRAFREADKLAQALAQGSKMFLGREYEGDPMRKVELYATNAVKVYTTDEHKQSDELTPELLEPHRKVWHAELNVLARRGLLPHLVVAMGKQIWEHMWQAFDPKFVDQPDFKAREHRPGGESNPETLDFANRFNIETAQGAQEMLLVRLHHPSSYGKAPKRADWVLGQPKFRELAELGPATRPSIP